MWYFYSRLVYYLIISVFYTILVVQIMPIAIYNKSIENSDLNESERE